MGNRELKDRNASRIWRTVVFAGAMLGVPAVAAAQGAPGAPPPPEKAAIRPAPPSPLDTKAKQIEGLDRERQVLYGRLSTADASELDKIKREIAQKDSAIKKAVDELIALRKPRPRTPEKTRPIGRGFVLA